MPAALMSRTAMTSLRNRSYSFQDGPAVDVALDRQACVPLPVQPLGQPVHQAETFFIYVNQGERAAPQGRLAQQCGERIEPKAGAARSDDDDLDRSLHDRLAG